MIIGAPALSSQQARERSELSKDRAKAVFPDVGHMNHVVNTLERGILHAFTGSLVSGSWGYLVNPWLTRIACPDTYPAAQYDALKLAVWDLLGAGVVGP